MFTNSLLFVYHSVKHRSKADGILIPERSAEAVSRLLSNSVDPLFYLSSFQTLMRKPRCRLAPGLSVVYGIAQREGRP